MTLRVLHLPTNSNKLPAIEQGRLSFISPTNEEAVSASLKYVCERILEASRSGLCRLKEAIDHYDDDVKRTAFETVRILWKDESRMARECLKNLDID